MKLITKDEAAGWWKWYSVHIPAIGALLSSAAAGAAASTSAGALFGVIPTWMVFALAACIFLATIAGRFIAQQPPTPKTNAGKWTS